jgi:hypothetical protein
LQPFGTHYRCLRHLYLELVPKGPFFEGGSNNLT